MKHLLCAITLVSLLGLNAIAKIDTTSLFLNTEALRAYCEKECLGDGDCIEKCMNLDKEDHVSS